MKTLLLCSMLSVAATAALPQNAALPVPAVFAPSVISGPANDGSPAFSPDGRTLLFTRSSGHWSVILESHLDGGKWSQPVLAPFSGEWPDSSPAWSPDGKYVVYQTTRRVSPTKVVSNLYRVERTATGWADPARLPDAVNITDSIWKPSVAANGDIYITVIGPGSAKAIYVSEFRDGAFKKAQPLPFSDGAKLDVDPEVAPDGSFLVFSSAGRVDGDTAHERLFLVKRTGAGWGAPVLIRYQDDVTKYGPSTDNEPKLGRDLTTLYFSSDRTDPVHFPRTRGQALEDVRRLDAWDNGNTNVWSISIKGLL